MPARINYTIGDKVGTLGCLFLEDLPSTRGKNGKAIRMGKFSCSKCGKSFESSFRLVRNNKRQFCDECSSKPKNYKQGDVLATNPTIIFLEHAGSNKFKKRLAKVKNCETGEEFIAILSSIASGHVKYGPQSYKTERSKYDGSKERRTYKTGNIVSNTFQEKFLLLEEIDYPYFKIQNLEEDIIFEGSVYNVVYSRSDGCPTSRGEKNISLSLQNLGIRFETQKTFPDLVSQKGYKLRFDFYLPDNNMLIEYDGGQHFFPVEKWGGEQYLKDVQLRDNIKNSYAKEHNFTLIRISYKDLTKINSEYISKIISSKKGENQWLKQTNLK